jgi:sec-independent protein translocase protein TatC
VNEIGSRDEPRDDREMTLLDHLEELRQRLLRSLIAVAVGMLGGWFAAPYALDWMIRRTVGTALVLSPVEAFGERFKLAMVLGGAVALPAILWQGWAFVVPGLLRRERRLVLPLVLASLVLFAAGAATALFLVVPTTLQALEVFVTGSMTPQFRLTYVLSFIYSLCFATGFVFQMPLVAAALTALRIVSSRFLVRRWRLALVGSLIVSALVTPGDVVFAQVLLGIPLVLLYGLSIVVAWILERVRGASEPALLDAWGEEPVSETGRRIP